MHDPCIPHVVLIVWGPSLHASLIAYFVHPLHWSSGNILHLKQSADQFVPRLSSCLYIDLNAKKSVWQFATIIFSEKKPLSWKVPTWKSDAPLCVRFGLSDSLKMDWKKISFLVEVFNAFGSGVRKRTLIFFSPRNAVVLSEVMFLFVRYSASGDCISLTELLGCVTRIPDYSTTEKTEVPGHEYT